MQVQIPVADVETGIVHLGTNDLREKKNDIASVELNITDALAKTRAKFPNLKTIGLCSIPPKKGRGANNDQFHQAAASENSYLRKLCDRMPDVVFIDNDTIFSKCTKQQMKRLYNSNDQSGLHFSREGRLAVVRNMYATLNPLMEASSLYEDAADGNANKGKRNRSELSATPSSVELTTQCGRTDDDDDE